MVIDHVEFFVPDRYEAAEWYRQTLGLTTVQEFKAWADMPGGPLMISNDDGITKLALFEGRPQGSSQTAGFHRVAFRVSADGFAAFLERLAGWELKDSHGQPVTAASVVDHKKAYSIYFCDPYGHRFEVTTYEYEAARTRRVSTFGY